MDARHFATSPVHESITVMDSYKTWNIHCSNLWLAMSW